MTRREALRDFALTTLTDGGAVHYVGWRSSGRTLCGRVRADAITPENVGDRTLCGLCAKSREPTEAEFHAYNRCTDCGVSTWLMGESAYSVHADVWDAAYPGYRNGEGVGQSRPCIGCLEKRLGRQVDGQDFYLALYVGPRLADRLDIPLGTTYQLRRTRTTSSPVHGSPRTSTPAVAPDATGGWPPHVSV